MEYSTKCVLRALTHKCEEQLGAAGIVEVDTSGYHNLGTPGSLISQLTLHVLISSHEATF